MPSANNLFKNSRTPSTVILNGSFPCCWEYFHHFFNSVLYCLRAEAVIDEISKCTASLVLLVSSALG